MLEYEAYKKEAEKVLKSLSKRNDLASQLLRLKIREKLVTLSPKVENDTNNNESIIFMGLNENGEIEDNNNNINN